MKNSNIRPKRFYQYYLWIKRKYYDIKQYQKDKQYQQYQKKKQKSNKKNQYKNKKYNSNRQKHSKRIIVDKNIREIKNLQMNKTENEIKTVTIQQFLSLLTENNGILKEPLKISPIVCPKLSYPPKLKIQIKAQSAIKSNPTLIDYKVNAKTIYLEVQTSEFLQQIQKRKSTAISRQFDFQKFNVSAPQVQLEQVEIPNFIYEYIKANGAKLYKVNLWCYTSYTTITKQHYDGHDNFLLQLQGQKIVSLSPPNSIQSIAKNINENTCKQSKSYIKCLSTFNIDHNHVMKQVKKHQILRISQPVYKVRMLKDQCLFIPRGWFHLVQSNCTSQSSCNLALNYWTNTIPTQKILPSQLEINFKHLLYRLCQNICEKIIEGWEMMEERQKVMLRRKVGVKYMEMIG